MNTNFNIKTQAAFDRLKDSPLFVLSLSSKELFHSNFIAWLNTAEPSLFKNLLTEWVRSEVSNVIAVQREFKNLDLRIRYKVGYEGPESQLIIENKVKSIPTADQLNSYSKNGSKDSKYLLLTFSEMKGLPEPWSQENYGKFIFRLKNLSADIPDSYHRDLINDYCEFTGAIYELFSAINDENIYFDESFYSKATELRIHDLYYKHQAAKVSHFLAEKPKSHRSLYKNESFPCIVPSYGLTNGTGLIEIFYYIDALHFFGVQLQGGALRLAVHSPKEISDEFTRTFWKNDWWGLGKENEAFVGPKNKNKSRLNEIGCYEYKSKTCNFLYRQKMLTENERSSSLEGIAVLIQRHFEMMMRNLEKIRALLEEPSS
jgi:hypothetical protein